ncbi:hypothetical protein QH639_19145 [Lysinibacillus sp. 1 U-2021]|uniref:hypothetical protein n=1 Tax=Lysinibacillus sp. 1 U-2021 TaxID=3039426 RepID=UPI002480935A|nr:hypothetical protein [Lysinibacillus sp. 1 U-2021]WGT37919.1 hypothetical protein QH639_19145 [Lysinibacillus sp. 1 U-2021]
MDHPDTRHIKITNDLRGMIKEIEELRKDYANLNQKYHQSVMLLNFVMRQIKEIDFDVTDLFKDKDLLIDCVMLTNHPDGQNKLYYDFSKLNTEQ